MKKKLIHDFFAANEEEEKEGITHEKKCWLRCCLLKHSQVAKFMTWKKCLVVIFHLQNFNFPIWHASMSQENLAVVYILMAN